MLSREIERVRADSQHKDTRIALLEKANTGLINKIERILLRYADNVSAAQKLPQKFTDVANIDTPKPKPPREVSQDLRQLAEMQRQCDIDDGFDPQDIEWYIGKLYEADNVILG